MSLLATTPLWRVLAGGAALFLVGAGLWAATGGAQPLPPSTPSPPVMMPPTAAPPTATPLPPAPTATTGAPRRFGALQPPIRYAALGASDTVGMGATHPDTENWAAQLAAKLPSGTEFQRFARSGMTLHEGLREQVPGLIAYQPDLITVWLVVNDGLRGVDPSAYKADLHTLLTRLTDETHATIVLLNAPDVSLVLPMQATPGTRATVQGLTQAWSRLIAQEAAAFPDRVLLVDVYSPSETGATHPEWVSPDRFHPSTAGYAALAAVVYGAMQAAGLITEK
jgi:lysophospholipase L1-like esterase